MKLGLKLGKNTISHKIFWVAIAMELALLETRKVEASGSSKEGGQDDFVHIRIQKRNRRKTLTTVQGLSTDYDLKKIIRACKKEFACNGTVVEHPEYGEVLQFQGDQREKICQWLTKCGLSKPEQLKVHGF